jgi:hypothetical protein
MSELRQPVIADFERHPDPDMRALGCALQLAEALGLRVGAQPGRRGWLLEVGEHILTARLPADAAWHASEVVGICHRVTLGRREARAVARRFGRGGGR